MRSYFQGILTGIAISISILLLTGAQKDRSSIILEMIIEDQKADIILKNPDGDQQSKTRFWRWRNHESIERVSITRDSCLCAARH